MDYEPHRGGLLELMGFFSIIAGILSILIPFPVVVVGLPLALTTWLMARSDLAKIHKGLMDPYGEWPTIGARTASLTGLVLNLLSVGWVLLAFLMRT
jgi:hypothetical protein